MVNSSSPHFRPITGAAMLFALLVTTSSVHVLAAKISIKNQCVTNITACDSDLEFHRVTCYGLTGGGTSQVEIDVGATWYRTIWGLPNNLGDGSLGYQAVLQANSADFTIDVELDYYGLSNDYYGLSNMDGYNLPLMVKSTSNQTCPSFNCTIDNLQSFCQAPNSLTGEPGLGCRNTDWNSEQPTNRTRAFSAACPRALSYSGLGDTDDVVGCCKSGGNYEMVFCP